MRLFSSTCLTIGACPLPQTFAVLAAVGKTIVAARRSSPASIDGDADTRASLREHDEPFARTPLSGKNLARPMLSRNGGVSQRAQG
eukprot:scaffold27777_cov129-Isochrysis_galbana.AAC.3